MSNNENQADRTEKKFRMPRWGWALIITSVAINLLVLGSIVGFWAHRHGPFSWHKDKAFYHSLTSERRSELRTLVRDSKQSVRPLWSKARDARKEVGTAMRAEPFDEQALRQALTALTEAEVAARSATEDMIISVVTKLKPEERKWFSHKFMRKMRRHHFKGHHRGPHFRDGP